MSFDKKVYELRKEKGLSQEALAEQLNTTRQAISKWENGQGFPEIEKLTTLSIMFGVSVDYLLKDNPLGNEQENGGYYVSKERVQSWLRHQSTTHIKIGIGFTFLCTAIIPLLLIPNGNAIRWVISILLAIIGLGVVLAMSLNDRSYEYKPLKRNALIFDKSYLVELCGRYIQIKKRYIYFIIASFAIILLGVIGLFSRNIMSDVLWTAFTVIYTVLFAASIGCMQYCFTMIDAYELLVNNDKFVSKFTTRILNKIRVKIDDFFRKQLM